MIKECVENKEMFTAYDITGKIRNVVNTISSKRESVPEHLVRSEVAKLWQKDGFISFATSSDNYLRTTIELNIGKKTILFYPQGTDPNTYKAAIQNVSSDII